MHIKGENGLKYRVVRNSDSADDFVVIALLARKDEIVFHGTQNACYTWIEEA